MSAPANPLEPASRSVSSQQLLAALQAAVTGALERKRRLGQYAVIWRDGQAVAFGEDAPTVGPGLQVSEPTPSPYDRDLGKPTD